MSPGGNLHGLSVVPQTGKHTQTPSKQTRHLIALEEPTTGSFKFGGTRIAWKQAIGIGSMERYRGHITGVLDCGAELP